MRRRRRRFTPSPLDLPGSKQCLGRPISAGLDRALPAGQKARRRVPCLSRDTVHVLNPLSQQGDLCSDSRHSDEMFEFSYRNFKIKLLNSLPSRCSGSTDRKRGIRHQGGTGSGSGALVWIWAETVLRLWSSFRRCGCATAPGRLEICTDGFEPYVNAIDAGLHHRVDYSQIIKVYSKQEEGRERYSPGELVTLEKKAIIGSPAMDRACTPHVERQNGTLRQWCKRLTRLTYAFSKNWDNLRAALALHFAYYNFCGIHRSLRVAPAMEAGIANQCGTLAI